MTGSAVQLSLGQIGPSVRGRAAGWTEPLSGVDAIHAVSLVAAAGLTSPTTPTPSSRAVLDLREDAHAEAVRPVAGTTDSPHTSASPEHSDAATAAALAAWGRQAAAPAPRTPPRREGGSVATSGRGRKRPGTEGDIDAGLGRELDAYA